MPASLIGLSSTYYAFRKKGIYDSVKAVFDLGFETVELGAGHSFEQGAWKTVKRIKRDFPEKNYTVHSLFPPPRQRFWFNPSLGLTKVNRQALDNLFRAASIVEARVVGIHPGFLNELGFGFDPERGFDLLVPGKRLGEEKSWRNFAAVIEYALSLSGEGGMQLAIENIHGHEARPLVRSPCEFERAFSLFPELRLLFDYGHALFEGNAAALIEGFWGRVAEVHMHWSRKKSSVHVRDDHSAISSEGQLEAFQGLPRIKGIPIIFEHGLGTSEGEVRREKGIVEGFKGPL